MTAFRRSLLRAFAFGLISLSNSLHAAPVSLTDVAKVSVGGQSACALKTDGSVLCWGKNTGDGSEASRNTAQPVSGVGTARDIASGLGFACAANTADEVFCWGSGPGGDSTLPKRVAGLTGVTAIAGGFVQACAIVAQGAVKCWNSSNAPETVPGLTGVLSLAIGGNFGCAILGDGSIRCWGSNHYGTLGVDGQEYRATPVTPSGTLPPATSIAAGLRHTCAAFGSSPVRCWGDNSIGELGDGTHESRFTPTVVPGTDGATQVAVGNSHSCALGPNGTASCWGNNFVGDLGDGSFVTRTVQGPIPGVSFTALWAGWPYQSSHSCGIVAGGQLLCWGLGQQGELGNAAPERDAAPVAPVGLQGVTGIVAGENHSCAIGAGGAVHCWGYNYDLQLGLGPAGFVQPKPQPVALPAPATRVTSGIPESTCAIAASNVYCWGHNQFGQLGDGTTLSRNTPVPASGLSGATEIDLGYAHACAVVAGSVWCWGDNSGGAVGPQVPRTTSTTPTQVAGTSGALSVSAGEHFTCARFDDGSVRCWGLLPTGVTSGPVATLQGAVSIATGTFNLCGAMPSGEVRCLGKYLRSTSTCTTSVCYVDDTPAPAVVPNVNAVQVASARFYSCALTQAGGVHCWGPDAAPLGPRTFFDAWVQGFDVALDLPAVAVSTGGQHACAVLVDGSARCWGNNYSGELGDNRAATMGSPSPVVQHARTPSVTTVATSATTIVIGQPTPVTITVAGASMPGAVEVLVVSQLPGGTVTQPLRIFQTNASGVAQGLPADLGAVGTHTVSARYLGDARLLPGAGMSAPATYSVTKGSQVLTFEDMPANATSITVAFRVRSTAQLYPTVVSLTPSVCSVARTSSSLPEQSLANPTNHFYDVRMASVSGTCTIEARRTGDENFFAASTITASLQVALPPGSATADTDHDGIPDLLEGSLSRDPLVKDNDVFSDARLFAMQLYRDVFGREAEPGAPEYYANVITGPVSRAEVTMSFLSSPEYDGFVSPLIRLYFAFFNRYPDEPGLRFHAANFRSGHPLSGVAEGFALSPEFQALYGTLDNGAFVDLVYQNVLGRPADPGGRAFYLERLGDGRLTRGSMMVGFSESPEYRALVAPEVFVTTLYVSLLRRVPDPTGFPFWVGEVERGVDRWGIVYQFIFSPEYRARFLP